MTTTAMAVPLAMPRRQLGTPTDRLIAWYALVSGAALLFAHRPAWWPLLAAAHVAAAAIGFGTRPARAAWDALAQRAPRLARVAGDWYPLLLVPLLYTELETLNGIVHGGRFFDDLVIGWEASLFGGQPSREWAAAAPWLRLSEPLHAAYLSYYAIIFGPPLVLYLQRRHAAFDSAVFTVMLVFFAHYLFFVYFPVQGPRYLFPPPGGALADGAFYQLAHRLLEAGSSRGAAFPSSHVGIAFAQALVVARFLPRAAIPMALLAVALSAGAIYGGFHYAIDALAGLVLGVAVAAAAPAIQRLLAAQSAGGAATGSGSFART